jgi:mannan endo-1,6-alpha-mannosidase
MVQLLASALVAALACAGTAAAEDFKLDSPDAIRKSAGVLAKDLMAFYDTKAKDFVPGLIPDDDYYWFQTGAFMTTMINYWQLTGDKSYNDVLLEGMLHQRGEQNDFLVANQTASTGNEDQCTWAQAAMLAAEYGFPSPPEGNPSWAQIAENVFNDQTTRIDNQTCTPGGLRWQIFQFNNGYDLQDAMSNTCYFNLGARLARFTGNSTYADAAVRSWDWMVKSGLLNTKDWDMWSSLSVDNEDECDNIDKVRSSLSSSLLAHGVASLLEQVRDEQTAAILPPGF